MTKPGQHMPLLRVGCGVVARVEGGVVSVRG